MRRKQIPGHLFHRPAEFPQRLLFIPDAQKVLVPELILIPAPDQGIIAFEFPAAPAIAYPGCHRDIVVGRPLVAELQIKISYRFLFF